ncbi:MULTISPECIES: hypothetical protein [unclassified Neorhizobium]|uniref:hypothetical protein n=1 Tax=unclassified Neorhizobium TaxID=2629175 RepID=UPI001FF26ED8|nr:MULTISPECIES: hypothetical protein [unclassified Neorhizobium]MCJ9671607.1 hypothetical protein [Neorhizobium sp. SHOUNA12B]MCJ9747736.1 hypothetical protein [Neorhizobium sp. SHOUNA12A]
MKMENQSQAGHPVQRSAASPVEEHANVPSPRTFNRWTELPPELRTMIVDKVASFRDRREAHETIRSFRASNKTTKDLIDNAPRLTADKIEALHRSPGVLDRYDAAYADAMRGRLPREACRVNDVTDKEEADNLIVWQAETAFGSDPNATAKAIIARFEVDNPKDVEALRSREANRDFENAKSALDSIKDTELKSNVTNAGAVFGKVDQILLQGARRDFASGLSAPEAIARNQESGSYELTKFSQDRLRRDGALRDISAGISPDDAADRNKMTNDEHRRSVGAQPMHRSRSRSQSR